MAGRELQNLYIYNTYYYYYYYCNVVTQFWNSEPSICLPD